ncbi:hypothetical protein R1sor_026975 [Riccia sorocarpa]|uniref:DELLA protein n=1 Tax=Riccia sorocarpa TaxID=122646 RepID=A0ABD3GCW7_9MARC
MPPFACELDNVSRAVQEQIKDLEQTGRSGLASGLQQSTDLLNIIASSIGETATRQQIVEVLHTAEKLPSVRAQGMGEVIPDPGIRRSWTDWVDCAQDLTLSFGVKSEVKSEPSEEAVDGREQLVFLPSDSPSPSAQASGSKRSISSMFESDEMMPTPTSSESNTRADLHNDGRVRKVAKISGEFKTVNCEPTKGKDLLTLTLANSAYAESSSSSRGSDPREQDIIHRHRLRCVNPSVRSSNNCDRTSIDYGSSDQPFPQPFSVEENAARQTPSSSTELTPDEEEDDDHGTATRGQVPFDFTTLEGVVALDVNTREGAAGVQHTLSSPSPSPSPCPRHEIRSHSFMVRGMLHSLQSLDGEILVDHSLFMGAPETGVEAHGLQLVHLLLRCAAATAKEDTEMARRILGELYQGASMYGDSMQRVAAYFAEGLAARVVKKDSPAYCSLMVQPSTEDYFSAFTTLYKVSPYFQFAHFTANQAILEAMEGQRYVHVIDLDIMQGFQWPTLIQAFASRPGGPPHLRITGVGKRVDLLQETGKRLASFAESFNVSFEFQYLVEENLERLTPSSFSPRQTEAFAVNSVLQLHRMLCPSFGEKLHNFMCNLRQGLNPCVMTVVEQEANHNTATFLGRFMEALHYYSATFDSLDASLPQQNEDRVKVEQLIYAQQIRNIVACEGGDRTERHEPVESWTNRMEMAGWYPIPLSAYAISQAKLLLQYCPCEGYRLDERNGALSLGWQERHLLTASAWAYVQQLEGGDEQITFLINDFVQPRFPAEETSVTATTLPQNPENKILRTSFSNEETHHASSLETEFWSNTVWYWFK